VEKRKIERENRKTKEKTKKERKDLKEKEKGPPGCFEMGEGREKKKTFYGLSAQAALEQRKKEKTGEQKREKKRGITVFLREFWRE